MLWTSDVVKDPWFPLVKDPSEVCPSRAPLQPRQPLIIRGWRRRNGARRLLRSVGMSAFAPLAGVERDISPRCRTLAIYEYAPYSQQDSRASVITGGHLGF